MLKVFIINAWMKDYEIGTYCRFVSLKIDIRINVLESTHNVSSSTTQPHKYIYKYFITNKYHYH